MPFSKSYQPRYAVYALDGGTWKLIGRYGSLVRALTVRAQAFEMGFHTYHDVN